MYKQSIQQTEKKQNHISKADFFCSVVSRPLLTTNCYVRRKKYFHGMGNITYHIFQKQFGSIFPSIPKKESFPMGQLTKNLGIPIVTFEQQKELGLCGIVFKPLDDSMVFLETPTEIRVSNTLWHIG